MVITDKKNLGIKKPLLRLFEVTDCLFLIAIALIAIVDGIWLIKHQKEFLTRPEKIDPGTYMVAIWILVAVSAIVEIFNRKGTQDDTKEQVSIVTLKGFLLLIACVVLMPFLGFTFSVGLLLIVYLVWLAGDRLLGALIFTVVVMTIYYLIFLVGAKVVLPRGIVGF